MFGLRSLELHQLLEFKKKTFGNGWRKEIGTDKKKKKYGTIRKIEDENRSCYELFSIEITKYTDILPTIS